MRAYSDGLVNAAAGALDSGWRATWAAIDMSGGIGRRGFVQASAAALATMLHGDELFAAEGVGRRQTDGEPLIQSLRLRTLGSLGELKDFYSNKLGLRVLAETPTELTMAGGATPITFVRTESATERPFYHFAFNIPENKIRAARAWQLKRSALITTPPPLRDAAYPDDVRHFSNWNAHSVFFWDPAGNLVEYIARHDLGNGADGEFTSRDILYASEIGLIIADEERAALARRLGSELGLGGYKPEAGGFFWALGDGRGLVLLLPRGLRGNVDPNRRVEFGVFPTEATLRGGGSSKHAIAGYPYSINVERRA